MTAFLVASSTSIFLAIILLIVQVGIFGAIAILAVGFAIIVTSIVFLLTWGRGIFTERKRGAQI